jgi:hypothetical protein
MLKLKETEKTHIRMSKLKRTNQTATSEMNFKDMAKILFWGDPDQGRHGEVSKLLSEKREKGLIDLENASYDRDQLQYLLTVMLVLAMSEERAENLYLQNFAKRCDAIREQHGLQQNQYWNDGEIPADWQTLDSEFEKESTQILLEALEEYNLHEIADRVRVDGSKQLYDIVAALKTQFFNVLKHFATGKLMESSARLGSIPETLQSSNSRYGLVE